MKNFKKVKIRTYLISFIIIIQFIISSFFFILHLIPIDFVNVFTNIKGLNLSNINDFQIFSGNIAILFFLIIILGLSIFFIYLKNSDVREKKKIVYYITDVREKKKLVYYITLISFLLFSIISIINSYDIARIFFEANPIDIIKYYPSDTATYIFRAFMIFLFVIAIVLLNIGFSIWIHKYIHPINTQIALFLLLSLLIFINGLSPMIIFKYSILKLK